LIKILGIISITSLAAKLLGDGVWVELSV